MGKVRPMDCLILIEIRQLNAVAAGQGSNGDD
jgi:hypothetical protein